MLSLGTCFGCRQKIDKTLNVSRIHILKLHSSKGRQNKMLILDEPTSALDPIAEDMVFKSFRRLCDGHGGIMISHHLSGVMSVDYIMVLEGGRLIESGSHEELLKLNGHYAMLYNIQAEKFKKGMAEDEK